MRIGRAGERVLRAAFRRAGPENMRKLVMLWLLEVGRRPPREAVRELLLLQEDVGGQLDRAAIAYDGGEHVKHRLTRYHDFFVERVRAGERVLDVGCGHGALAYDLAERAGAFVVGIDLDEDHLRAARERRRHDRLELVHADATAYAAAERFDVVVLSNVLEHVEERQALLRALVAGARPSRLLFRVPMSNRHWSVPLRAEVGLSALGPGHFVEYDESAFRAELKAAGLRVTHLQVNWGEIWAEAVPEHG